MHMLLVTSDHYQKKKQIRGLLILCETDREETVGASGREEPKSA